MTIQQAAQQAMDVQGACNLSGVVFSFAEVMRAICNGLPNAGTHARNTHPIVTLFLLKLCELNGCGTTLHESYERAWTECQALAQLQLRG
jgi:phosphate/sulfate permease